MKRKLMLVALLMWVCVAMAAAVSTLPPRVASAETVEFSPQEQQEIKKGLDIAPVPLNLQNKNRNLIGLGSYIVNAQAGCNDCHTNPPYTPGHDPHLGQPPRINKENYLAGGQQFGPFVSRNITPDENGRPAGLTLTQFIQVMRRGTDFKHAPPHVPTDEKDLLQVMPWPVFRNMTDRDLRSIYEYLRAIPHAEPAPTPDQGQAKHVYELNGTFADALGGPSLEPYGGTLNATNYSFGPNHGLSLSNAIVPNNYSIEMIFSLVNVGIWRRLVDFKDLGRATGQDEGLYSYYGTMYFWPVGTASDTALVNNVDTHVVLTRDAASDLFVVYVNGVEDLSFTDTNKRGVFSGPNNVIFFFIDDIYSAEYASGVVDRIRIYDGALSATEVAALAAGSGFRSAALAPLLRGRPARR